MLMPVLSASLFALALGEAGALSLFVETRTDADAPESVEAEISASPLEPVLFAESVFPQPARTVANATAGTMNNLTFLIA